jgi:hypothetical protein
MAKTGPKPMEVDYERLELLAAGQLTDAEIMRCMDISETSYLRKKKKDKQFKTALKRGRAKGLEQAVASMLKAMKANTSAPVAMKFLEKHATNWKPGPVQVHTNVSGTIGLQPILDEETRSRLAHVYRSRQESLKIVDKQSQSA